MALDPFGIAPVSKKGTVLGIRAVRPLTVEATFRSRRCDSVMVAFVVLTCTGRTTWSEGSANSRRVTPALTNGTSLDSWTDVGSFSCADEASGCTEVGGVSEECLEIRLFGVVVEIYVEDAKLRCVRWNVKAG